MLSLYSHLSALPSSTACTHDHAAGLRGGWAEGVLIGERGFTPCMSAAVHAHALLPAGLSLAMGLLPEEFPVVFAVFLAMGAWRLSKHNVLTRRNHAIETLGACTVLCVDKTVRAVGWTVRARSNAGLTLQGTLTMNCMTVTSFTTADGEIFSVNAEDVRATAQRAHSR